MSILNGKIDDFFGLDVGTSGIRLAKLNHPSNTLQTYAYMPLDSKIAISDSKADQQQIAQAIKTLIAKSGIKTKNAAVGLPSQQVFTTLVDIERLEKDEIAKSIQLQADALIPTPIAESKIDWELIGPSPQDKTKVEVLLTSVSNSYAEAKLDMLETLGLNVIAFEPDNLAMARALIAPDSPQPQIILDMGNITTDVVIVMNGAPRLTRTISTGYSAIIKAAAQNLNIDESQATQFVAKFGLNPDKLEGQIYNAISGTIDMLVGELDKSIKFFSTRYQNAKIERIIVTGNASTLPDFPVHLANNFNVEVEIGNSWRNVTYSPDRQNELSTISWQYAVAVGLAERHSS